jgi:hypothetical protein
LQSTKELKKNFSEGTSLNDGLKLSFFSTGCEQLISNISNEKMEDKNSEGSFVSGMAVS